jgi:hypothetical protein
MHGPAHCGDGGFWSMHVELFRHTAIFSQRKKANADPLKSFALSRSKGSKK